MKYLQISMQGKVYTKNVYITKYLSCNRCPRFYDTSNTVIYGQ